MCVCVEYRDGGSYHKVGGGGGGGGETLPRHQANIYNVEG